MSNTLEEAQNTIPPIEDQVVLAHNGAFDGLDAGGEQLRLQNQRIIDFATEISAIRKLGQFVSVEVWYERTDIDAKTSVENFDAVVVDVSNKQIVGTVNEYDDIDPEWRSKRV